MNAARIEAVADGRLALSGELVFASVPALLVEGERLFKQGTDLSLNLSGVVRADSAGVALLVEWMRLAARRQVRLQLLNMPAQMLAIARVSGLDEVLPLARS